MGYQFIVLPHEFLIHLPHNNDRIQEYVAGIHSFI